MALAVAEQYLSLLPALRDAPPGGVWVNYDVAADVLYINYCMPAVAAGGDEIAPDVIERRDGAGEVVGYTIINASLHGALNSAPLEPSGQN